MMETLFVDPHTVQITRRNRPFAVLDLPTWINVKRQTGRVQDLEAISELELLLSRGDPP